MKTTLKVVLAAALIACVSGSAEAKGKPGGGGGGVTINYGCQTFQAGKVFRSPDGTTTKKLLTATFTCYLCNMTTRVCTVQSPATLVGWTFTL